MKTIAFIKKFGLWIFVVLLSISFIAYFGLDVGSFSQGSSPTIGRVDGYPIVSARGSYFYDAYEGWSNYYVSQGYNFDENVRGAVINRAFYQNAALYVAANKAKDLGLSVDDRRILRFMSKNYFGGDQDAFNDFFKRESNLVKKNMQIKARQSLLQEYLERDLFSSLPLTQAELDHFLSLASLQKKALVGVVSVGDNVKDFVREDELKNYFEQNKSRYQGTNASVDFSQVSNEVLEDYMVENYQSVADAFRTYYRDKMLSVVTSVNGSDNNLSAKRRTFVSLLQDQNVVIRETDYVTFFTERIPFKNPNFSLSNNDITLPIMKTKPGNAQVGLLSGNELKIVFVFEEQIADLKNSPFVSGRYKQFVEQEMQQRVRSQYYKNTLADFEVELLYGSTGEGNQ